MWGCKMEMNPDEIISRIVYDVFEKLAFMFGEVADRDELPEPAALNMRASMTFAGDMTGSISLIVPENVCPEIAANVLGKDPDDDIVVAQSADALKEVLNVLCGNILTAVAGEAPVFDLSVPEVDAVDAAGWKVLLDDKSIHVFLVDDSPVLLQFVRD